jgi:hypothetical protein
MRDRRPPAHTPPRNGEVEMTVRKPLVALGTRWRRRRLRGGRGLGSRTYNDYVFAQPQRPSNTSLSFVALSTDSLELRLYQARREERREEGGKFRRECGVPSPSSLLQ